MNALIRPAEARDLPFLTAHDHHIAPAEMACLISAGRVLVAERDGVPCGWLRWNLFWDNTPFMNLLYLLEDFRGQGLGRALVRRYEEDMRAAGYPLVLTSTQADEYAQHFYRRLGYRDVGCFTLPGESCELLMAREMKV